MLYCLCVEKATLGSILNADINGKAVVTHSLYLELIMIGKATLLHGSLMYNNNMDDTSLVIHVFLNLKEIILRFLVFSLSYLHAI